MGIPDRIVAASLLLRLAPKERRLRHVSAVAEIAAFLAAQLESRGISVDRRLIEAAGLLHDIDKMLPRDELDGQLGHGHAGASWLAEHGWAELGPAVAAHPIDRLRDGAGYRRWVEEQPWEVRVVAYADRRAAEDLVSVAQRLADQAARHPRYASEIAGARAWVERLEALVCGTAGVAPEDVRREPWVEAAFPAAVEPA